IDLYKNSGDLHHAYFFVGHKVDEVVSKLKHFLENIVGIKTSGNPDFSHQQFKTLMIEDARTIASAQERKSFIQGSTLYSNNLDTPCPSKKIFIIQADFITEEAQNALLKVFEEPTAGTHFFIISPQDILLPTLRSRMQVIPISLGVGDEVTHSPSVSGILDMKLSERLAKVKEITDAIKDNDPLLPEATAWQRKTKQDAITLLNQIERELYEKGTEKNSKGLKICEHARTSLYDRGAPVKMILEHVMLTI
ncbi:MAG: hypothetical protein A3E32_01055, partial [Candidatus Zambryskibacteria bacterium RIFCSPHIGHO2_12_FULL_38_37]